MKREREEEKKKRKEEKRRGMRRIASVGLGWFEIGNERSKLEEYAFIFLSVDLFEILEIDLETGSESRLRNYWFTIMVSWFGER